MRPIYPSEVARNDRSNRRGRRNLMIEVHGDRDPGAENVDGGGFLVLNSDDGVKPLATYEGRFWQNERLDDAEQDFGAQIESVVTYTFLFYESDNPDIQPSDTLVFGDRSFEIVNVGGPNPLEAHRLIKAVEIGPKPQDG